MTQQKCIFCRSEGPFHTVSHIIPESLGGRHSPIAREGTTCDACNQYFGQKVESKALQSFPFSIFRLLSSVPSKKGRLHKELSVAGELMASGSPGFVHLHPNNEEALDSLQGTGQPGQFRLLAEISEPPEVSRLLLKVGLEMLAQQHYTLVQSSRFDAARVFCRSPKRSSSWWFIIETNPDTMVHSLKSRSAQCQVEVGTTNGAFFSVLRLPGLALFTPLELALPPENWATNDPNSRVVHATY